MQSYTSTNFIHRTNNQNNISVPVIAQEQLRQCSSQFQGLFDAFSVDSLASAYAVIPSQEQENIRIIYEVPTLSKPLESTIHPRTLKEFARTGSNPIKCAGSHQRDAIQIKVSQTALTI